MAVCNRKSHLPLFAHNFPIWCVWSHIWCSSPTEVRAFHSESQHTELYQSSSFLFKFTGHVTWDKFYHLRTCTEWCNGSKHPIVQQTFFFFFLHAIHNSEVVGILELCRQCCFPVTPFSWLAWKKINHHLPVSQKENSSLYPCFLCRKSRNTVLIHQLVTIPDLFRRQWKGTKTMGKR